MPNYDYLCPAEDCGEGFIAMSSYDDRDNPLPCPECGAESPRIMSMPTVLRASFLDGQRRKNDPAWQALRAQSKLKLEHARAKTRDDKNRLKDEMDLVNGKTPPKRRKRPSEIFDK